MSVTPFACAAIAGLALGFAVLETRRLRSGRLERFVSRGQARRRVVGAFVVAATMLLVALGLEVIDPRESPVAFLLVWGAVLGLTLGLLVLGLLDWRELGANRELERTRELLRLRAGLERSDAEREAD